jgi:hypothetical protein
VAIHCYNFIIKLFFLFAEKEERKTATDANSAATTAQGYPLGSGCKAKK